MFGLATHALRSFRCPALSCAIAPLLGLGGAAGQGVDGDRHGGQSLLNLL